MGGEPVASDETIVTFFTTHMALRGEKVLREAGVAAELIPTPRAFSADCTIALVFPTARSRRVRDLLHAQGIEVSGFHESGSDG